MRTLVIGDIHGGYKALIQLLDRVAVQPDDRLLFLGDYVDGWSQSFEVVSFLISLSQKRTQKKHTAPIFLRGNHDALVLDYFEKNIKNKQWLRHGGQSTIDSYASRASDEIAAHMDFLKNTLVNYYELDGNGYFHAGFQNLNGPQYEYYENSTFWDRTLWEMALALNPDLKPDDLRYPDRLKLYKEIYIGHTPTSRIDSLLPVNAANVWNIDTAAAYLGPLTALCVETKEIWQSDPVYTLYPDEQGRN